MRSEVFWVVVFGLTSFCAGLAGGVLLSFRRHPAREAGPFPTYEERMVETFDLDEERVRNLRYILQDYQEKIDALKERNIAELDPDLVRIGHDHRDLVRRWVIPEHRRQEFDLWVRGLPAIAPGGELQ
jgi:hypothetical protein